MRRRRRRRMMRFVGRGRGFDDCGYVYESVKLGNLETCSFFLLSGLSRRRKLLVGKIFFCCREESCWWERFFFVVERKFVGRKVFLSRESLLVGKIFLLSRRKFVGDVRFLTTAKPQKWMKPKLGNFLLRVVVWVVVRGLSRRKCLLKTCERF